MRARLLAFAFLALASATLHAQSADVRVFIPGPFPPALATLGVTRQVLVTNDGPSPAANIVLAASAPGAQSVYVSNRSCAAESCSDSIGMLDPGQSRQIYLSFGFAKPEARTLRRSTFSCLTRARCSN
ncbi:MAG: hypothetical protein JWO97_1225 [Acidobacteria bacterium]|nr:hypothetical protein [Acidobacteriota bacterium]